MKDDAILFRIDHETKTKAQAIANAYGLTLSSVLSSYLHQIAYTGRIPLNLAVHAKKELVQNGVLSLSFITECVGQLAQGFSKDEIRSIFLFGSYSRGEATANSDVDFLIVPGENLSYFRLGELNESLKEKLGKNVDTTLITTLPKTFLPQIKKERILLYESQ